MKYTVTARMALITSGVLALSEDQAKPRMHNLKALGKNRFEITHPVQFKAGEEIGYEGDLPKTLAENMTTKADIEAAAKKATAAEAKAAAKAEADAEKAREKAEMEAAKEWDANKDLREKHQGDFNAYMAELFPAAE